MDSNHSNLPLDLLIVRTQHFHIPDNPKLIWDLVDGSQPNLDPVAKNGGEASAYNVSLKKVGNPEASPAKAQEKEGTPYNISLKKVDTVERKEPEAAESTSPYAKVELKSVSSTGNKAEGPDAAAIYKEQQAKLKSVNKWAHCYWSHVHIT